MRIVHVIERLGRGGASRSLLALAKYGRRRRRDRHVVVSLLTPDPAAVAIAHDAGVAVLDAADAAAARAAVSAADITQVHFWNTPEMYAWLRGDLPPTRLLLTLHVAGEHPAQVMTRPLADFADLIAVTTPYSLDLPLFRQPEVASRTVLVLDSCDFARLGHGGRQGHPGFNVGYVGTVGFVKLHPAFVSMSAAARLPEARFLIAGGGDGLKPLQRQATLAGAASRFEWLGYVEDIGALLARLDVFGYPLRSDTYATGELVLQEAMYAGVSPVVFAHGAPARLVRDGETGLVVRDPREYAEALELLAERPEVRARLGANAAAYARHELGAENVVVDLLAAYERLMAEPRRARCWTTEKVSPYAGADAFVAALGDAMPEFRHSLLGGGEGEIRTAENAIAAASPVVTDAGAGGVLHYRRFYAEDPYLRLWSGLVLLANGRPALAAAELLAAVEFGLASERAAEYLARALATAR